MYEVGDKVRIIDNFWEFRYYSGAPGGEDPDIVESMKEDAGRICEIEDRVTNHPTWRYRLKDVDWWWDERWLEPENNRNIDITEDSVMDVFSV